MGSNAPGNPHGYVFLPELVAKRVVPLAKLVCRVDIIVITDCGFARGLPCAGLSRTPVHPGHPPE